MNSHVMMSLVRHLGSIRHFNYLLNNLKRFPETQYSQSQRAHATPLMSTHYKSPPQRIRRRYNNSKNESPLKTLLLLRACYHTCPVRSGRAKTRGTTRIGLMLIFEVFLFEISIYTRTVPSLPALPATLCPPHTYSSDAPTPPLHFLRAQSFT